MHPSPLSLSHSHTLSLTHTLSLSGRGGGGGEEEEEVYDDVEESYDTLGIQVLSPSSSGFSIPDGDQVDGACPESLVSSRFVANRVLHPTCPNILLLEVK